MKVAVLKRGERPTTVGHVLAGKTLAICSLGKIGTRVARLIEDCTWVAALKRGRQGRAAVDVYETEPVTGGQHALLALPNAPCMPHLGYNLRELYESLYTHVIDNILAIAAGQPIKLLNPGALSVRQLLERGKP